MQQSKIIQISILLALLPFVYARGTEVNATESILRKSDNEPTKPIAREILEAYLMDGANCESIIDRGLEPGVYHLDEALLTKMGWVWGQFEIYCEKAADVGWTVIQRRGPFVPHENFNRTWDDYARGFGDLNGEFWFGNEWIHKLTSSFGPHELRVELEDWDGQTAWAQYSKFQVFSEENSYQLSVSGFTGTAGDSLNNHNSHKFATYDKDTSSNCGRRYGSGSWYSGCFHANLNGIYYNNYQDRPNKSGGIIWQYWKSFHSLKSTKMMIRSKRYRSLNKIKSTSELKQSSA